MQLQHADSHDAIAAQLRDAASRRAHDDPSEPQDPSELNVTPAISPEPVSEPSLRAAPLNDNMSDIRIPVPRERSGRGVGIVLLAVCAGIAATMAWHSYGDEAKQRFSDLVPQLMPQFLADEPSPTQSADGAKPKGAASQVAASQPVADPPPAQEGSASATAPDPAQEGGAAEAAAPSPLAAAETPPAQAAVPPELTQSIETMSREIASLKQTVEQLQAGQQQLSHDVAKVSEHRTRHNRAGQTLKPTSRSRPWGAPVPAVDSRTPAPSYSPPQVHSQAQRYPQANAQREAYILPPPAPTRLPSQPGDSSVPRPPMPVQ
jgi:hypothetical protein